MIFKLKPKKSYADGETRRIRSFCWFPTRVQDDIIWMEHIVITQEALNMEWEGDEWINWKNISYEVERTE